MNRSVMALAGVAALAILVGGCGGEQPVGSERASAATTTLYFVADDGRRLVGVPHPLPDDRLRVHAALEALLSRECRPADVTTAIPSSASLRGVEVTNAVATVDVTGLPKPGKPIRDARIVAQLVRTVVGLSGVKAVAIRSEGAAWGLIDMKGEVMGGPYDYESLASWGTVCAGGAGSETATGECFTPLP